MTERIRDTAIRIKLQEMTESIDMVKEHLPDSADSFVRLGIVNYPPPNGWACPSISPLPGSGSGVQ